MYIATPNLKVEASADFIFDSRAVCSFLPCRTTASESGSPKCSRPALIVSGAHLGAPDLQLVSPKHSSNPP